MYKNSALGLLQPVSVLPLGSSRVCDINPLRDSSGELVRKTFGREAFLVEVEHSMPGASEPCRIEIVAMLETDYARHLHFTLFAEELEEDEEVRAEFGPVCAVATPEGTVLVAEWMTWDVFPASQAHWMPAAVEAALHPFVLDHEPLYTLEED